MKTEKFEKVKNLQKIKTIEIHKKFVKQYKTKE